MSGRRSGLRRRRRRQCRGVYAWTFRRYVDRFEETGLDSLVDKRVSQVSARRSPTDEVLRLEALYRESHQGWSVAHLHPKGARKSTAEVVRRSLCSAARTAGRIVRLDHCGGVVKAGTSGVYASWPLPGTAWPAMFGFAQEIDGGLERRHSQRGAVAAEVEGHRQPAWLGLKERLCDLRDALDEACSLLLGRFR